MLCGVGILNELDGGIVLNWEVIGAFAEVTGALGVLVTLAYLAIQTRDNVRVMRSRAGLPSIH